MNKFTVFLLTLSSTPLSTPTPTPAADTCLCKAILKLWYYYAMHTITIAFACSQIQYKIMTISLYHFSGHASRRYPNKYVSCVCGC